VLLSFVASCYYNCCTDGSPVPEIMDTNAIIIIIIVVVVVVVDL
jgi:hypothetical protein